ncbi:MAG: TonB-dependent receptor [Cocleimonas sp.]
MQQTNHPIIANYFSSKNVYASLLVLAPLFANVSVNAADVDELEEVIVSADFRETTLDDSTVSVTVKSEEELEKRGAEHVSEILNAAPNVNVAGGASRERYYQIRGIGERSQFNTPINPSVGLYVDGIDLSRSGGSATLFDVDQVEVIRGPQGTKFGANALAGIINIKTNEPTDEWEGKITVGLGNFNKQTAGIAAGGPLIKDKLLARFSLHSNKSDGYINNTFLNRDDTNNVDEVTARGHLKWLVTQDLTVDLRYLHLDIDNGYDAFNYENDRTTISDEPGKDEQNTDAFSINSSWDMNDKLTLETSVSHSNSDSEYSYDDDWSFVGQSVDGYSAFDQYLRKRKNTSLEVRLLSGDEGRIFKDKTEWVAGLYHSDKSEDLTRNYIFLPSTPFVNAYDTKNTALYGQLDTQLTEKTKLITGLRVEKFRADYTDSNNNNIPADETLFGGKLGLEYEVNENHLTHATVSRGYKAGGINPRSELSIEQKSFDTEFQWNFEVGVNSSLLNDKINTRVSAFYAKRKDQQTKNSTPLPDGNNGTRFVDLTSNAASGSNYGLEAELDWNVNNKLKLMTSIGLLQAEFDEYITPARDFSGRDQAHAPNYQYSIGAEYKINSNMTAGLSLEGKDGFFFSDSHDERADSYKVLNANISYKRKNMTTTFWGRNLLDEDYDTRGFFFGNNPNNGYTSEKYTQKGEPRVFGVNVSIDF